MCLDAFVRKWDFPGGRLHKSEGYEEGFAREIREELGIEIVLGGPRYVYLGEGERFYSGIPRYYIIFDATLKDPSAKFTVAEDEILELKWIGAGDVSDLATWEEWREILKGYFKNHAS